MNKIRYFVLLSIFSFVRLIYSQTVQTADSSFGIYPLQVGNLWQYWTYDYLNGQTTWTYGWTTKVVSDTLMPDGNIYSVLKADGGYGEYGLLRQDFNKVLTYSNDNGIDSQNVIYDFYKTVGDTIWKKPFPVINDTFFSIIRFDQLFTIFGLVKRQWVYFYEFMKTTAYNRRDLTNNFGITFYGAEGGDEWFLRGAIINGLKYGTITSVKENDANIGPSHFELFQNYPNPFNPTTTINYAIPKAGMVVIKVYDLLGKEVAMLVNGYKDIGRYSVKFDASKLSSGVYFYTIKAGSFAATRKMILMK